MAEYIEREEISSIIKTGGFWEEEDREVALTCVDQTPAADVAPVVHGRWIHNPDYESWAEMYMCSACNRNALTDGDYRHKLSDYCPNCGAKMDREEQDDE